MRQLILWSNTSTDNQGIMINNLGRIFFYSFVGKRVSSLTDHWNNLKELSTRRL